MINNGVILLRLHGQSSELKAAALLKFIEKHFGEIIDSFSVVSNNAIRIRRRIN